MAKRKWFNGLAPDPFPQAILLGTEGEIEGPARLHSFCDWQFSAENGATWSLNSQGPRIEFEDSLNCGGTNALRQDGQAVAKFVIPTATILTLTLRGRVERQNEHYDVGQVFLDADQLIVLNGSGEHLGCSMVDVEGSATVRVDAGEHTLTVNGDTVDGLYHVGCFFQLDFGLDPPIPIDGREWYAGYNALCYRLPPTSLTALLSTPDILATVDQLALARIHVLLYDDPTAAAAALQALLGPAAAVAVVPNSAAIVPGTVIGVRPDLTIALISGTSNADQAAQYSLFSGVGPIPYADYSTNAVWRVAASEVEDRISALGANPVGRIIVSGHSYGGAVAMLVAGDYLSFNPDRHVDCLTFGAAKPGDIRLARIVHRGRLARISNDQDPVPEMPPAFAQILGYLAVLPADIVANWEPMVQPTGQLILFDDGTMTNSDASTMSIIYLLAVVNAVLGGPPLILPFAHSMSAYVDRLARRLQLAPG